MRKVNTYEVTLTVAMTVESTNERDAVREAEWQANQGGVQFGGVSVKNLGAADVLEAAWWQLSCDDGDIGPWARAQGYRCLGVEGWVDRDGNPVEPMDVLVAQVGQVQASEDDVVFFPLPGLSLSDILVDDEPDHSRPGLVASLNRSLTD